MFKNKLTYKYYENIELLIIYNYFTRETLYYENISAKLLYNILSDSENNNYSILEQYQIPQNEYKSFIYECTNLLSAANRQSSNDIQLQNHYNNDDISSYVYKLGIMIGMHIDITKRCNFRCLHCYHTFDDYDNKDLTYEEIDEMFKILNELGVFKVTLSGGEPFLRKDIFKILKLGSKYHFIFEIFTNGSLLSEDIIKQLSLMNVAKLSFSYYGDKSEYQHITQYDGYESLMKIVKLCIKYDIDYDLKFILMKYNYHHLPTFIKLTQHLGIRQAVELNLTPRLDGTTDNLSEKLDFNDYIDIFQENKNFFNAFLNNSNMAETDTIQCNAGRYGLYCDYKDEIYPCVSYRKKLGTYKDLIKIWNGDLLSSITSKRNIDFSGFKKHSYCNYCYEICPGLSIIEGKDEYDCNNSSCEISKAIECLKSKK